MDKVALETLKKLQGQGQGERGVLSVTVQTSVFRMWWVDETSPDRMRWLFLDGVSRDGIGTPFYVRAWWPIPLSDLTLFDELDQIPMNSTLMMSSNYCTLESTEDFYLDNEEQKKGEGEPKCCLGMKTPERQEVPPADDEAKQVVNPPSP